MLQPTKIENKDIMRFCMLQCILLVVYPWMVENDTKRLKVARCNDLSLGRSEVK